MKNVSINSSILESGIYRHAKPYRCNIDRETRRSIIKKKIKSKLRDKHYMERKIKIAISITMIVTILSMWLVG